MKRYSFLSRIVEAGTSDTKVYIILRGSVRVFSEVLDEASGRSSLFFAEDLTSGEVFGEAALGGMFKRTITVVATTTCDIAVLDSQDYLHVLEGGSRKLIIDEKTQFLSRVPLFKHSDFYRKFELAHALSQCEFERGQVIFEKGKKAHSLMFLMNGRVDFVTTASSSGRQVVSSTEKYSYIGESGILQAKYKSKVFVEAFTGVASSRVECLFLPETHYHVVESHLLDQIRSAFFSKRWFRVERRRDLKSERRRQQELDIVLPSAHETSHTNKPLPSMSLQPLSASRIADTSPEINWLRGQGSRPATSYHQNLSQRTLDGRPHTSAASNVRPSTSLTASSESLLEHLEDVPRKHNYLILGQPCNLFLMDYSYSERNIRPPSRDGHLQEQEGAAAASVLAERDAHPANDESQAAER